MADALAVSVPGSLEQLMLHHQVEQFLFAEAQLLDEEQFEPWLGLMAPDIRYVSKVPNVLTRRNEARLAGDARTLLYDDDIADLGLRVARLKTGLIWAEDPPSRMVRQVANVLLRPAAEEDGLLDVASIVSVYCCRRDEEEVTILAHRRDRLRREGASFRIARREIRFAHNSFRTGNLSFFL